MAVSNGCHLSLCQIKLRLSQLAVCQGDDDAGRAVTWERGAASVKIESHSKKVELFFF